MNVFLEHARSQGLYARRFAAISQTAAASVVIEALLIPYANLGDERRPVIISSEPFKDQAIFTNTPNEPAGLFPPAAELTQKVYFFIDVLSADTVRLRMSMQPDWVNQPRDFGILTDPECAAARSETAISIQETANGYTLLVNTQPCLSIEKDPFALHVGAVRAPLQDRNVHGLLCAAPSGFTTEHGAIRGRFAWELDPDEALYGLGERFTPINQRGARLTQWTTDAWGVTTNASYKNIPLLLSSRGYALFFHTTTPVTWNLGADTQRSAEAIIGEEGFDLFIIHGPNIKHMLSAYTLLTGRASVPPLWAFGVWLSRCRYQTREEAETVARKADELDIPCDVVHLDPAWLAKPGLNCDFIVNEQAFPDLPGMIQQFAATGKHICLWELPYVTAASPRYAEGDANGYFLKDSGGNVICADFSAPPADGFVRAVVDFTNPAAVAWWQNMHRPLLQMGVSVFKTDFGEGVPENAVAFNGMTGRELRNYYPLLYNRAVSEVIAQETGRDGFVWGRSAWAGSQRYPAQWAGDPKTDIWSMRATLRGGLNYALSAPGIWSHDIGGFYGTPPQPEVYIRWAEFGLFSPLARAHGATPREPWEYGSRAVEIFRAYAKLRLQLAPYYYSLAWRAHTHGEPMIRPLVYEFPDDPNTAAIDDVYMLGSSLLAAPVFSASADSVARTIYLPQGLWYDFWTHKPVAGGAYITQDCPLDYLPVFVRAGAILPMQSEKRSLGDALDTHLTAHIFAGAPGRQQVRLNAAGDMIALEYTEKTVTFRGKPGTTWQIFIYSDKTDTYSADLSNTAEATIVIET